MKAVGPSFGWKFAECILPSTALIYHIIILLWLFRSGDEIYILLMINLMVEFVRES